MPLRRRLNLFAFPPETNALFSMLILASIILALFFGSAFGLFFGIRDPIPEIDLNVVRSLEVTGAVLPIICSSGIAALGTLCLAFLFYLRGPSQIRKQRKLRRLTEKDQEIQKQVSTLALQAGVDPPVIEMPLQGLRGSDAQAFGVGNERTIALDGGFRVLRKTKPDLFNALLRHELAHFANEDIGRSYFSDALWKSIRWLFIIPFLFILTAIAMEGVLLGILNDDLLIRFGTVIPTLFSLFIQSSFVIFITGVIWTRLLRTRELYADWQAAFWGSEDDLKIILQEEIEKERPNRRFNIWKLHPDPKERIDALGHSENLFKLSPILVFLTGSLLAFIFMGLYFSFATFLGFNGILQSIRASSTGALNWALTGLWWSGFVIMILMVFGLFGWLINGILLPQIQKQTILELINKRRGFVYYAKMGISSLILIAGVELGFFMTPFGLFAPNYLLGVITELFIIGPVLVITLWWYLVYVRFIILHVVATQTGSNFSIWKRRFIEAASILWIFLFFMPVLFWSRILDGTITSELLYINLGLLAFTFLPSLIIFGTSWAIIKLFFENQPKKCPHCGKITAHAAPAVEFCEHCGGVLGEWLFISEKDVAI